MNSFEKTILKISGLRLTDIDLACEMMMFGFEGYAIHSQCFTRIIKNNDILVTTLDYQSWDGEDDSKNDERYNLDKYKPVIMGGKVTSVKLNPLCDLEITLDNGIVIQILVQNSYAHYDEEREQYRFFETGSEDETEEQAKNRKHYVVYSKHVDVD